MDSIWSMPLTNIHPQDTLQILVENQGRMGHGGQNNVDFKGKYTLHLHSVNIN